jgi:hypothetical protein
MGHVARTTGEQVLQSTNPLLEHASLFKQWHLPFCFGAISEVVSLLIEPAAQTFAMPFQLPRQPCAQCG